MHGKLHFSPFWHFICWLIKETNWGNSAWVMFSSHVPKVTPKDESYELNKSLNSWQKCNNCYDSKGWTPVFCLGPWSQPAQGTNVWQTNMLDLSASYLQPVTSTCEFITVVCGVHIPCGKIVTQLHGLRVHNSDVTVHLSCLWYLYWLQHHYSIPAGTLWDIWTTSFKLFYTFTSSSVSLEITATLHTGLHIQGGGGGGWHLPVLPLPQTQWPGEARRHGEHL